MYFLSGNIDALTYSSFEEEISRRAKNGDTKSYLYIVPTGAQARELINWVTELSSPNAISLPYILSLDDFISRLCRFAKPEVRLISDAESAVFIELALKDLLRKNALQYFEGSSEPGPKLPIHRGTFERLIAGIAGLKESGISPERLISDIQQAESDPERSVSDRSALRRSKDMALIYQAYQEKLGLEFIDKSGQYNIVADYFELPSGIMTEGQSKKIQKAISILFPGITDIFIGSFIHIQRPAEEILFALKNVESIRLLFGVDYERNNISLFALQEKFISKASEFGFAFIIPQQKELQHPEGFDQFRKRLKASLGNSPVSQTKHASLNVFSYAANSMKEEMRFAAKKIKELVSAEKVELSRICIASYHQDDYASLARETFREYGIPANITDRARLDRAPLYLSINALFDLAEFNLSRRSLLRLLSSPYLVISGNNGEDINAPNLYEVITEYRLHQGSDSWEEEIGIYIEELEEASKTVLDEFDESNIRIQLEKLDKAKKDISNVENLLKKIREPKTPLEFHHTVLTIIRDCRVVTQLLNGSSNMIAADTLEFDTRSYRALMELLEELLDICSRLGLDNTSLPLSFYTERIRTGALRTRFAPRAEPGRGVIITSFEQTIGYQFDYLFLVGLNDGIFPEVYTPSIFNLREHQPSEDEKIVEQRYLLYQTLSSFQKEVYLIWHTGTDDKKSEIMRSQFVDSLEEICEFSKVDGFQDEKIFSTNEFFRYSSTYSGNILELAKENNLVDNSLKTISSHIPHSVLAQKKRSTNSLTEYSGSLPLDDLTEAEREHLLNFRDRVYSISQLETYASCPFKFFSKYILGLEPGVKTETEEGLSGAERGSIMHEVLYHILTGLRERDKDIRTLSDEDFHKVANEILALKKPHTNLAKNHPFVRLDKETVFMPPDPGIGMLQKFIEAERKFENYITKPSFFEATFGLRIGEEKRDSSLYRQEHVEVAGMKFRGKIDRIDMDDTSGIFTVTDYKSGKQASNKDVREGRSLQLPLYLRIAEDLLRSHLGDQEMSGVAGIYHALLGKESKQQLALGIREFAGKAYEGHKRGGKLAAEVETAHELQELIEATINFAQSYVAGITKGQFPLADQEHTDTACRYCDYKKVCRVGEAMENGALRKLNQ
jgi:ATP-dependent helicase/nuclease subunit B